MSRAQYFSLVRQYAALSVALNVSFGEQLLAAHTVYTEGITQDGAAGQKLIDEARRHMLTTYRTRPDDPEELLQLLSKA